jgi:hypothetical protein
VSRSTPDRTAWPRIRAALITLALAVGLVAGLPLPADAHLPKVPGWYARLVPGLRRVQELVLTPFRPLSETFVLTQRWNLFAGAKTRRYWLSLEGRETASGRWRLLYRPHDPEHDADSDALEYRRVRGAWNPRGLGPQPGYAAFVSFEARRLLAARPELGAVRARIEEIDILPHGAGFRGTGRFTFELVRERAEVLP